MQYNAFVHLRPYSYMNIDELRSFQEVVEYLDAKKNWTRHLLLGNGFSMAYDKEIRQKENKFQVKVNYFDARGAGVWQLTSMPKKNVFVKSFCSACHQDTNHRILFSKHVNNDPEEYDIRWSYSIVECLGCEGISYRTVTHDIDAISLTDDGQTTYDKRIDIYPSPLKGHRPLWHDYILPQEIRTVYNEAINAFRAKCHILTAVGFRAVIEAVCNDQQIPGRTLETKINNLAKNRMITEKEAARLHPVRFIGNDSIHEMAIPTEEQLYVVLEIIEHLLQSLYIIDHRAKGKIDTITENLAEFVDVLEKGLKNFKVGDEFPLVKFLGKDTRRLSGRLAEFEAEMIQKVHADYYLKLGKLAPYGESKANVQHFIVNSIPPDFSF